MAAFVGLCFAQVPAFIQQYMQRLGGHVDEARLSVGRVSTDASLRTLDASSSQLLTASLEQRLRGLEGGEQAISGASATIRPFVFLRELDVDIANATLNLFEPAVPLSLAGVAYGLVGMVAGWLLYELVKMPVGLAARRNPRDRSRRRVAIRRIEPT